MMNRNKKIIAKILIALFCMFMVTGFAYYKIDFKFVDKNSPLVNLGSIINSGGKYLPGDYVSTLETKEEKGEDKVETSEENKPDNPVYVPTTVNTIQDGSPKKDNVDVTIKGTHFYFDSNNHGRELDVVKEYIESWKEHDIRAIFDLEYADYKTVLALQEVLKDTDFTEYEFINDK